MSDKFNFHSIDWKWVFISMVIFFIIQIAVNIVFGVFGILTLGIGFILFIIAKPVAYFLGGFITGYISPGITLTEPALGAVFITVLGTIFDSFRHPGRLFGMVIAGIIAFILALWGAYMGEKAQRGR